MQARPPKSDGRHGRDPDPARCAAGDRSRRTRGGARGSPVPIARRRHRPWCRGGVAQARGVGVSGTHPWRDPGRRHRRGDVASRCWPDKRVVQYAFERPAGPLPCGL